MNCLLQQLARDGDISWLSYYFAEFISTQDGSEIDGLAGLSAALVSEANLAGNVCVELAWFSGRPLFQSSHADARMPLGGNTAEWSADPGGHSPGAGREWPDRNGGRISPRRVRGN